jgi:hypothetical protein
MKVSDIAWKGLLALAMVSVLALGCDDDDDDAGLYVLSSAVADPVPVTLDGDVGTLQFTLTTNPVPNEPSATLLGFLTGGTIALNVANDVTGVNYNLVQGVQVTGDPAAPGEYRVVDDNGDGTSLTITFYNEFSGSTIRVDGDYTATVSVSDNEYFVVEEFARDVTVTEL